MDSARFNAFWFLSVFAPAAVMFFATYFRRKSILVVGILLSLSATYVLCNAAVQEKWRIRFESAKTEQELERASADGANLVFTAILIAPLESVAYTTLWSVIGWRTWRRVATKKAENETSQVAQPK